MKYVTVKIPIEDAIRFVAFMQQEYYSKEIQPVILAVEQATQQQRRQYHARKNQGTVKVTVSSSR